MDGGKRMSRIHRNGIYSLRYGTDLYENSSGLILASQCLSDKLSSAVQTFLTAKMPHEDKAGHTVPETNSRVTALKKSKPKMH
jgi:hypothetical protein